MAIKRVCMICGKEYEFCSHCNDFDPTESWGYLYHDKDCMEIGKVWYAYRGKEITKGEAKDRINKYPNIVKDICKHTSIAANEIKEILGYKEMKHEEAKVSDAKVQEVEEDVVDNEVKTETTTKKRK